MPRKAHWLRCQRCKKFVTDQYEQLYHLGGVPDISHPRAWDAELCMKCGLGLEADPAKAIAWLDKQFPTAVESEAGS